MTVTTPQPVPPLAQPVTSLFGVGPERAAQLGRLEIRTVMDLLLHRPHRYEDRRHFRTIRELSQGQLALTRGTVVALGVKWFARRTKSIFELVLDDGTARLHCRWWNLPYMEKYFARGDEVVVFGKVQSLKPRVMDHPENEVVELGEETAIHLERIVPIYPLTEGLPQRWLRALMWRTLAALETQVLEPHPEIPVAASGKETGGPVLPARAQALRMVHFPESLAEAELGRQRLALDELLELQLGIRRRRKRLEANAPPMRCEGDNRLIKPFLGRLGFKLTPSQTAVLRELRRDMAGPLPMRRLLQGDVGSGKTVVAACCALIAIESGLDAVLMAPTEILAEQHFRVFSAWFSPLDLDVCLRTGSHKLSPGASSPSSAYSRPQFYIGTHALLEEGFTPRKLGLVIIDEQHKFGVHQREELLRKGSYPHLLVMTATPIPRTLGLTLYGDLDISLLAESPPGRGRIHTFVRTAAQLPKVFEFIRAQLKQGRQAYIVYPRVEDTGQSGVKAVLHEFETAQKALAPFKVGLLHGRMESREKERAMDAFRENQLQALVATSLIEVGLDVPNAVLMLVENAEMFGLAQLHQLRGRIGRGAHDSYCILVGDPRKPEAKQRLQVLEGTTDGFNIAEADLQLRGPGELLGLQQSGMPRFRFADLAQDLPLVHRARALAAQVA